MKAHYEEEIQRFLDRELSDEERQSVGEHLIDCRDCREFHDELREGRRFAANLASEDAPRAVWNRVEAAVNDPNLNGRKQPYYLRPLLAFGAAVIAMLLFVPVYLLLMGPSDNGSANVPSDEKGAMLVEKLEGSPSISEAGGRLSLAVGEVLETDASSSARIKVADIGKVDISPNSKVKLLRTGAREHRLQLERGKLSADITAPPRLFIVDTPTATAVDLGCAYTLEVGDDGSSRLNVTSGYVALESEGKESFVPAGAYCETRRGGKMSTPYFTSASDVFRSSLEKFDFGDGGETDLSAVISESRRKDTLTLWHLLFKVPKEERLEIFARIGQLVDLDAAITADGVLRLDSKTMESLKDDLMPVWYEKPGWYE